MVARLHLHGICTMNCESNTLAKARHASRVGQIDLVDLRGFKSKSVDFFLLAPPKLQIFSVTAMVHTSRLKLLLSLLCRINMMLWSNMHLCYEFLMRALWIFVGRYGSVMPSF